MTIKGVLKNREGLDNLQRPMSWQKKSFRSGLAFWILTKLHFWNHVLRSGAFYSALLNVANGDCIFKSATGIEIDPLYYDCAKKLWSDTGINIFYDHFANVKPDKKYNFVLTNPPYVRHHNLSQDKKHI